MAGSSLAALAIVTSADPALTPSLRPQLGSATRAILRAAATGLATLLLFAGAGAMRIEDGQRLLEAGRPAPVALAVPPTPTLAPEPLSPYPTVGYRNGRPRTFQVVRLGASTVALQTAQAFLAMRDAAASHGIVLSIESGFRTVAEQQALYRAWRRGRGNRAARPGHSNHQSGRALDISVRKPEIAAWLASNASRFGFQRTVADEPWHWEYMNAPRARGQRPVRVAASKQVKRPVRAAVAAKSPKASNVRA
ncbi:MAG: D-alanyl-D-alanine carboxypeptidase family protein, partial [Myxococcota bacterium]|nr:D-alanyl-D-alanine carboxypeptidase family protein [Myxococcota bacterium]